MNLKSLNHNLEIIAPFLVSASYDHSILRNPEGGLKELDIISLGCGVQSTALYLMSSTGVLPRADYAIFSDTGKERKGTYETLEWLQNWAKENNGIPIIVNRDKNLWKDLRFSQRNGDPNKFAAIPAFTKNKDGSTGMLRRQCTSEYKIMMVDKEIRRLYFLIRRQRRPKTKVWLGITLEEIKRLSFPQSSWKETYYPFVGYLTGVKGKCEKVSSLKWRRSEVINWLIENGYPVPMKSACVFCPFMNDVEWHDLKTNSPDDFEAACLVDDAIRNSTKQGVENPIYLHRSCIPLREVVFDTSQTSLFAECSGNCHL